MKRVGRCALVILACGILLTQRTSASTPSQVGAAPVQTACSATPSKTGDVNGTLVVDKLTRTYLLHIPPHLHAGQRYPLVIMLHGYTGSGIVLAQDTSMSAVADEHGFLAVYPDGVNTTWHTDAADDIPNQGNEDDVRFISRLIDAVSTRLCVDPQRVYASGWSSGGSMAYRLACDLAARIAAMAPVEGTYTYTHCAPVRPVSVIAFHGTANTDIPYHGGGGYGTPDIPIWARGWAHRDGCTRGPTQFARSKWFTAIRYTACRSATEVQLYTMIGEGDVWPTDSDLMNQNNNADELIWHFFAAHPRH